MLRLNLLLDTAHPGSWNMAVDEALLEQADSQGIATLRFYQWQEPTLSLGYFQAHTDRHEHAASRACPLVRRASGGGALVHDQELTYSFAAPIADRLAADVEQLYYAFHETLIEVLRQRKVRGELFAGGTPGEGRGQGGEARTQAAAPFLCFERRAVGDVILDGAKILGSAQRRRRGAVLQHGGVLLAQSPCAAELPGIAELSGVEIGPRELIDAWLPLLAQRLHRTIHETTLSSETNELARSIEREKFGHEKWTHKR